MTVDNELVDSWDAVVAQYHSFLQDNEVDEAVSEKNQGEDIAVFLMKIFLYLTQRAKIYDNWKFSWMKTKRGVFIHAYSEKQNHNYTLGLYESEIYLKTNILEARNIKYMSNEFWAITSNLSLIKNFRFQENAGLPKIPSFDTKNGKANIYKLIKNFILLEEHDPSSTIDLGWFESSWDISCYLDEMLDSGTQIIKGIHKLNYLLYRFEYQKQRTKAK